MVSLRSLIITGAVQSCKARLLEGYRSVSRLRSVWAILGLAAVMSATILAVRLPFTNPGAAFIESFAAVDQVLILLITLAWIMSARPWGRPLTWPAQVGVTVCLRCLGASVAVGLAAVLLISFQGAGAALKLFQDTSGPPAAEFARLAISCLAYALALSAWGALLVALFRPVTAAFLLLALVLSGFVLPQILRDFPSLSPLLTLVPDFGSIAPVTAAQEIHPSLGIVLGYATLHAAAICALVGVLAHWRVSVFGRIDGPNLSP